MRTVWTTLRDAYSWGELRTFDLTHLSLRVVVRPYKAALLFTTRTHCSGMHAVEDIVSRYQMYAKVYFRSFSRDGSRVKSFIETRFRLLPLRGESIRSTRRRCRAFLRGNMDIGRLARLGDGVLSTYFSHWLLEERCHLGDLSGRFINRRPV